MHLRNKKGNSLLDGAYSYVVVLLMIIVYLSMSTILPSMVSKSLTKVVAEGELISFLENNQYYLDTEGELLEGEYVQQRKIGPVTVKINSMIVETEIAGLQVYRLEYAVTAKAKTVKPTYLNGSTLLTRTAGIQNEDD